MSEAPLFKTKQVKIDTLGEYLQQIRKQLNLDIKTVSILAQIKPSYLELLEAGAFHQLPADVYIRGFLKSLADFYHIQEQVLIDQYEKERGFEPTSPVLQSRKENWLSLTPRTIILGFSLLVALVAIIYIGLEIRSVLIPPYLSVTEPGADVTVEGNSVIVSGVGEIGAEVYINNQPVLSDQNGNFTETLLLSPGLNVVEVSAKNKFDKVSRVERKITSNSVQSKPVEQQDLNLSLIIGPNSAWLNIQADGVLVHRGTMLPGAEKNISAKNEIIVTTANAGSTKIIYNGKDLGILGREGEVIRNVEFASIPQ
jgi:cytoskeleton protein RodZ